ncbi:serine protease [Conidiobolus coronatus NRRL 28638]|uniref:Serine protease n=1 Tax=Conidiobolus coronatus (strain ATCC 28846 / CBS 209.66 / NRRL 28638) TaxID=796925 RepID=A0A137PCY1_CONC2|nr:serine protease [Conidiobolus coronatus NRRL 28638]|eukprot:KXN72801.1 serine protease [Conidiobolus coronatus NRRL 28638]
MLFNKLFVVSSLFYSAYASSNIFLDLTKEAYSLLHVPQKEVIPGHYIVMLKSDTELSDFNSHYNQLYTLATKFNSLNGDENEITHVYNSTTIKGYAGKFDHNLLKELLSLDDIELVEQDSVVHINNVVTQRGAPWGLARVSHEDRLSFRTFNKYTYDENGGEGVTAYVVDTGVNIEHVDFEGRARWGKTMPSGDKDEDGNGHGTHVAGTIAGKKYGVAKKAEIVAVKVLRSNGSGSTSDVIGGINWTVQDHNEQRLKAKASGKAYKGSVANMSLGGGYSRALNSAVDRAVRAGITYAVAAGNDNQDACDYSPASATEPLTVGASTISDDRAWFSNHGRCVDVFAPGKDITSTWIGSKYATNTISGTSMASPHVCGIMAYYASRADKVLSPEELKNKVLDDASEDKLSDLPGLTPNLLIYNHESQ